MKINQGYPDPKAQESGRAQETSSLKSRAASAAAGNGRADEVNVSSLASAVQGALSDAPERVAFLEQLSSAYAAGTYQPDPVATASGIVDDIVGAGADAAAETKQP